MDRYPDFIQYLVVCLVAVYALADGHLLCAPCLASSENHCVEHCDHLHRQTQEVFTSTGCCSDDHSGRPPCNGNDLPAIIVQCSTDELEKLLEIYIVGSVSTVYMEYQPKLVRFHDTPTFHTSAPSLRLHLLYGVLVI